MRTSRFTVKHPTLAGDANRANRAPDRLRRTGAGPSREDGAGPKVTRFPDCLPHGGRELGPRRPELKGVAFVLFGELQPCRRILAPVLEDVGERTFPKFQTSAGASDPGAQQQWPPRGRPATRTAGRLSSCASAGDLEQVPGGEQHCGRSDTGRETQELRKAMGLAQGHTASKRQTPSPRDCLSSTLCPRPRARTELGLGVHEAGAGSCAQGAHSFAPVRSSFSLQPPSLPLCSDHPGFLLLHKSSDFSPIRDFEHSLPSPRNAFPLTVPWDISPSIQSNLKYHLLKEALPDMPLPYTLCSALGTLVNSLSYRPVLFHCSDFLDRS